MKIQLGKIYAAAHRKYGQQLDSIEIDEKPISIGSHGADMNRMIEAHIVTASASWTDAAGDDRDSWAVLFSEFSGEKNEQIRQFRVQEGK